MLMNHFEFHYIHPLIEQPIPQPGGVNIFADWLQAHGTAPPPPAETLPNAGIDIFALWLHEHPPVLIGIA